MDGVYCIGIVNQNVGPMFLGCSSRKTSKLYPASSEKARVNYYYRRINMAASLLTLQSCFCLGFSSNLSTETLRCPISSVSFRNSSSSIISQISTFSSARDSHNFKLKHIPQASTEGIPNELIEEDLEESKFVPLNADKIVFGPPALLLLGFQVEETTMIQDFLKGIDGEFLKVIHCTEDMISSCSLWEALNTEQNNLEAVKIAKSVPRICFLSGLSGEEMLMFIEEFPEAGIEPAIFAALVPNSADKPLQEVVEEILGDHEMMAAQESSTT